MGQNRTVRGHVEVFHLSFLRVLTSGTDKAHYVERLRKTGADRIESQLTIEDPATLAKPWVINVAYQRATTIDRLIHDTFDNDCSEVEGAGLTIAPPAASSGPAH